MTRNGGHRVRFIIKPNLVGSNPWLALRDDLLKPGSDAAEGPRELRGRFAAIQVWFSDLDDFDSISPAKAIARKAICAGYLNPTYAWWVLETLYLFCRYGKKRAEAASWKRYYDAFLKRDPEGDWLKDEAFRFIDSYLTADNVSRLLYPGVEDFYAALEADIYLVTRNLERIAWRYSRVLPYAGFYHEVRDKAAVVEGFIAAHPDVRRYGSGGDSSEDAAAAEVLDFHYRKGRIDAPLCLFRAASPHALDRAFNVYVGKDRSGLAGILAGKDDLCRPGSKARRADWDEDPAKEAAWKS